MKNIYILLGIICLALISCEQGIDDITKVDPGADETAPQITLNYPTEGTEIKVFEETTSLDIDFEVKDDIEVKSINILLDGSSIAQFSTFTDYRIVPIQYTHQGLEDGEHELAITAIDLEGKSTTVSAQFTKAPPYQPLFEGEQFYMAFDGDYMDLISFKKATPVESPGFAGDGYVGADAYKGAENSYLSFPMENLKTSEFSAAFWYKVDANPDRAGILVVGDDEEDRFQGFRLFREGNGTEQRIKLNVGTGAGESWNDGGVIDVAAGEWVHVTMAISATKTTIFFNGVEMLTATLEAPIDWTGCETMTIGAGGPTFSYWNHLSDKSSIDELRLFDKALTATDIQLMINALNPYTPQYDGESFYMPFDGDFIDLVGSKAGSAVGTPTFVTDGKENQALMGATDTYVSYPSTGLTSAEFSASMWYRVNASPDRAGILVIGDDEADRLQGFRLFREGSADEQRIKLNVGTGTAEVWNDGDVIDATTGEWVHIAVTIANDKNTIYINGSEARSSNMDAPIDWTGVGNFTIGAGGPTFSYWDHLSDLSALDELRFFSKALSPEEVAEIAGGTFTPKNFGSTLFLPFDGNYIDDNNGLAATVVGTPFFAGESKEGSDAYAGTADAFLTFPIDGLFNNQFSGAFWYKVDGTPDRAGILTVAPPMIDEGTNDLSAGFRLFREGSATEQRIKLHLGTADGDVWNDGEVIDVTANEWVHIAFTVTETATQIYFNGEPVTNFGDMTDKVISWENCSLLSIGSGAPNFMAWGHLSDTSYIDQLYLFDRALSQEEIQALMNP
ncbi:LamG domain-containing protein [Croceivirga radicis]|uniref:LamG domain-containing protein n=1 Tax=Croceivirga radicis TaxID=1929488 RepID=UPI000255B44A|nr:LamG domain-containing protein [Croceivirga radicis]